MLHIYSNDSRSFIVRLVIGEEKFLFSCLLCKSFHHLCWDLPPFIPRIYFHKILATQRPVVSKAHLDIHKKFKKEFTMHLPNQVWVFLFPLTVFKRREKLGDVNAFEKLEEVWVLYWQTLKEVSAIFPPIYTHWIFLYNKFDWMFLFRGKLFVRNSIPLREAPIYHLLFVT